MSPFAVPTDDVLLTTAQGQAIRFPVDDVRVFKGRDSDGVRGVRLADNDHVISLAILLHVEATPAERAAYLKQALAVRRSTRMRTTSKSPSRMSMQSRLKGQQSCRPSAMRNCPPRSNSF